MDILLKFNFAEKIQHKLKSQQKPEEISLQAEMKLQLKIGVATGSLFIQSIPSHDITKINFGEEIEDLSKRNRDLKIELATRMTKATSERGCDKGSVVETKGNIQSRIFGRNTTLMSRRQLNITEVATSI